MYCVSVHFKLFNVYDDDDTLLYPPIYGVGSTTYEAWVLKIKSRGSTLYSDGLYILSIIIRAYHNRFPISLSRCMQRVALFHNLDTYHVS